jgi:hypothetical protein
VAGERIVDMSNWQSDISYREGLDLCEQLGLIERLRHGGEEYGRPTQQGINVLVTMMQLAGFASHPENILKSS